MADLEGAASDSLEKVRALEVRVTAVQQRFGDIGEKLADIGAEVDAEWDRLSEQVQDLLEKVGQDQTQVAEFATDAGSALEELRANVGYARETAEAELTDTASQVSAYGEQAIDARRPVEELDVSVDQAFNALREQAVSVQEQLDQAMGDLREFLEGEVATSLRDMQEEMRERAEATGAALDEIGQELESSYDQWEQGLQEVEETVAEAFGQADDHLAKMVDEAMDDCSAKHGERFAEIQRDIADLDQALEALTEAIATAQQEGGAAAGEHGEGLAATGQGLETALEKIATVREYLSSFAFVQG